MVSYGFKLEYKICSFILKIFFINYKVFGFIMIDIKVELFKIVCMIFWIVIILNNVYLFCRKIMFMLILNLI